MVKSSHKTKAFRRKMSLIAKKRWKNKKWVKKELRRRRDKDLLTKISEGLKRSYRLGKGVKERQAQLSSPKARRANSLRGKKNWSNDEFKAKMLKAYNSTAAKKRRSDAAKLAWSRRSTRQRHANSVRQAMIKSKKTLAKNYPNGIPQLAEAQKRRWSKKEVRQKQSKALVDAWRHPIKGKHLRDGLYKAGPRWRVGMTSLEKKVHQLLKSLGYSYKWTGGGKGRILQFVPDFMHTRFKRVIEVYGEHWHKPNSKKDRDRIRQIKKEGYACLVIWQKELADISKLSERIRKFHSYTR